MPTASEKLKNWLCTYPGWEWENIGLYPKALEEISRQQDVLGNSTVGCRYQFTLFWQMTGQGNEAEDGQKMLDFQYWVQQQSASGKAPVLGDIPEQEKLRVEKGGLTAGTQTVTYTATLIADFMKVYEVN